MHQNKTFLAIIPARGGSKRLPRKNILALNGKPLIAWTIDAALKSRYLDKVVVTSDDDEILEIAKQYGSQIIKRPEEFSNDTATSFSAVKHTLEQYEPYDYIVLLQPTSPLRTEEDIDRSIEFLFEKEGNAVISVCETDHSPLWTNTLPENNSMENFLCDEIKNSRSQDLETYYRLNGAIYICKTENLLQEESFFLEEKTFAYVMNRENSVDIDEELDFKLVEIIINKIRMINET